MISRRRLVLRFRASHVFLSHSSLVTSDQPYPCNACRTNREVTNRSNLKSRNFIRLLRLSLRLNDHLLGKQLHCLTMKFGVAYDVFVGSALSNMYSKCRFVREARKVFDDMASKDLAVWNIMLSCYLLNDYKREAFNLFHSMRTEGFIGDGFTFSSLINFCSRMICYDLGIQTHCLIIKLALESDLVVGSSLVDMYAKCAVIKDARHVFDRMDNKNVVCWNTIIVGYGKCGEGKEALMLFNNMLRGGLKPDGLTLASILSTCANLASSNEATQVHGYVVKNGFQAYLSIGNALIIAYAKCGSIDNSARAFSLIPSPDCVTWSSMISSYAHHGLAMEAINKFEVMLHEGIKPNRITFLAVISACSHAGFVDAGVHYFSTMIKNYQIKPSSEHFACLIDLLSRAGYLDEASDVLSSMPFEPDASVLGALIGACNVHRNAKLAEWVSEKLFYLEPRKLVNYALLSNIYVAEGHWENVLYLRRRMKQMCSLKIPGCSWIEIGGKVHTFVSHDRIHLQDQEIYCMLDTVIWSMRNRYYICDTITDYICRFPDTSCSLVLHD
ncbi:pentatricopeptide repeat-containing protein At2g46050, mitochondrial-like isoform X1 [Zingiber officinale]|uniref:pentatricopeptide repeat-containing protein At2g46050, mitochondrial-like isoform X1 n=2 Tax=Zingiber officinale TaxID=94328 RepID=UPI001C4CD3AC|nr:pentatricopeptide repeat-containing protein At2g46050, mitochondrial-like isoform X1 [Zingiber officinale]XP_042406165.1 pentatricopeptide repeat-containing protein At2g46050, mitochondrial-like isoform X1 [Zingiber officinale]XP_042406166.1 pentatricopeptide repeat-containing protein At2g46050, mitochondrial-like isoform X1 [Zingiber officinale]